MTDAAAVAVDDDDDDCNQYWPYSLLATMLTIVIVTLIVSLSIDPQLHHSNSLQSFAEEMDYSMKDADSTAFDVDETAAVAADVDVE